MKHLTLLIFTIMSVSLLAQPSSGNLPQIDIPCTKYVLDNGLTLLVHEDNRTPLISLCLYYHVGSKDEKQGKTGFAHLFEHIMFTSTEHWDNFDAILQSVGGGNNNASTYYDRTNFYETFTKAGLERVLWLEADRMGFLAKGLDSVKVDVQRGVVMNEKRQYDNQPYNIAEEILAKGTYPQGHPYSWTVIGSMEDLEAATIDDVKEWFNNYYGPNNAVLSLAGDIKPEEALTLVKKYFDAIPACPPITRPKSWVAKMTGTQHQVALDRVPQARLYKVWNVPGWGSEAQAHLNLLGMILASDKSSRLYKRLVSDEGLASEVFAFVDDKEISGQFYLIANAREGVELSAIDAVIEEELRRLLKEGPTQGEVERVRTAYYAAFVRGLERLSNKSDLLAACETYMGRPDHYKQELAWMVNVTPAQLKQTANEWLEDGSFRLDILPYPEHSNAEDNLDRTQMPAVDKTPNTAFPTTKTFTLSNGLPVYLIEQHNLPLIRMHACFDAGYAADHTTQSPGLAYLTGTMMMEGTENRSGEELSEALNNLGSTLQVYSRQDKTYLSLNSLSQRFDASLNLFAEVLLKPTYPEESVEREKARQLLGIQQELSNPSQLASRVLNGLLYGAEHPYGQPNSGLGTEKSVQAIKRSDIQAFHQSWFRPNNGFLVVAGDISEADLKTKLEKAFADWEKGRMPVKSTPTIAASNKSKLYLIDKPGAAQSVVLAANLAPTGFDKDWEAYQLMNTLLGGSFLSRLNANLREEKHWTYGARSIIRQYTGQGAFVAVTSVQSDKTAETVQEMLKEFKGILSSKPITEAEFRAEQTNTVLSIPNDWETLSGLTGSLVNALEFGKTPAWLQTYTTNLQALTTKEVNQAAKAIVKPDQMVWVIVGDKSQIEESLKKLPMGEYTLMDPLSIP